MSKKIRYSQPLAEIWDCYKKANKNNNLSPEEFLRAWLSPQILNPFMPDGTPTQTNMLVADLFYADTIKRFLHLYFVDKALRDFLINLRIADFDGLKKFIIENGEETDGCIINTFGQTADADGKTSDINFGIHIPYENRSKGYAFGFTFKPEDNTLLFTWLVGKDAGFFTFDQYETLKNKKDERSEKILSYFRLAVNTIAYMNTFPECVVDGVPNHVKDEYAKKVTISGKVLEAATNLTSKKMMSPHFRRGYFKMLTSDRFTRKKGQLVFVHETMVNGKAKTIYTASNLEKMVSRV